MADPAGWSIDAELAFPPLMRLGWTIDALPWRTDNVDWNRFDAVYIGTPWDYPEDPEHFIRMLEAIDKSSAILVNDIALVHWTMPKTYLRDLEDKGAPIVPSVWGEKSDDDTLDAAFNTFGVDKIIVKPVISTNATDTYLLERDDIRVLGAQLHETFADRPHVVQPFIENIRSEGEFSLFYFNKQFSHAIQKIPQRNDFRVQEEYGAKITAVDPEAALQKTADQVMQFVDPLPVYARADFVRGPDGHFLLMELELIEPSMYLRMDAEAPWRFAEAFHDYVLNMSGSK
jgi:hypothetical protein